MSGEILFLAHRMPFPPDRGDKIRSYHILHRIVRIAPVHVATFAENANDLAQELLLSAIAKTHCLAMRSKPLWRAGVEALARNEPVSIAAFRDARMADYVQRLIAGGSIETIYVFSGQMGQYVPADFKGRVLMDLVDVDSAKFEAYGQSGRAPRRWIDAREGCLLRAEEERIARAATETLFVSEAEAELFRSRLSDPAGIRVSALRNGIDAGYFDPAQGFDPAPFADQAGPHIVFTGQMDYAPNIAAAQRLIARILPALRQSMPDVRCHIVGRNPPAALMAYHGKQGCRIWGEVPDVRPYVAGADLVMVPLEIARGVQNKVLEAMAMARPVLLTPGAATGIEAEDGVHFAIADGDDALTCRALELLNRAQERQGMGTAARRFVIDNLGWDAILAPLERMIAASHDDKAHRNAA